LTRDLRLTLGDRSWPCRIGRGGLVHNKLEGDGGTPIGDFPLRRVLYRPDREVPPVTGLPVSAILPDDLWCDDPGHALYNRPTRRPFSASAEDMWRADHAYDLVIIVGHNDDPVIAHKGSAIFIHIAHDDGRPTAGCLALTAGDLRALLSGIGRQTRLIIV